MKASFGKEFVAADVRAFCKMNDIAYATVTKKIKQYNLDLILRRDFRILKGEISGSKKDIVLLNAASALYINKIANDS